ncbi:hypothetical protein [Nonomuraea wenchangensis]|uniref:Uncharacterized protein n=1 Tax=Nonomuraea wenchangensis TaxID=568860 RepID=A0A1I0LQK4_9ACTN|nr:hypothetical protein [Nonomuraea wenchangensis]SEU43254.1 hypothetical protein SAMN05421811_12181 [Nonomuraea wenchangensis]
MGNSTTDLRFTPLLAAEVQAVLEKHGYRLPAGGDHVQALVLARVEGALQNLAAIFEGRTW